MSITEQFFDFIQKEYEKIDKGGPGSGRKPKFGTPKKELERRKEMKEAIEQFYQHRTPRARAEMIERFRQRERKPQKEYTMGLVHPWD